jgi:predicted N-acetyltransferase YhbS
MASVEVRAERAGDVGRIHEVNALAFGQPDEADLVDRLRQDPAAWIPGLSLVAVETGRVVGHLLVSRVQVVGPRGGPAASLAPMAVVPGAQGRGIGSALVRQAIDRAASAGEQVVVVLGHADYYPRFGFAAARPQGLLPAFDVDDAHWMALDLSGRGEHPRGTVAYPAAFGAPGGEDTPAPST